MNYQLEKKLEYVDEWLTDCDFSEVLTKRLISSCSILGIDVYHVALNSKYSKQYFEIEYRYRKNKEWHKDVRKVTFNSEIKPVIKLMIKDANKLDNQK